MEEENLRRTWAEIDMDALAHNYRQARRRIGPNVKYLGVVKADAYGHGAVQVSRKLEELGADYLAVSSLDEAKELRRGGIQSPILILGHTPPSMVPQLIEYRITQAVSAQAKAEEYSAAAVACGGTLKVHIKVDTGMSRLGFLCHEDTMEQAAQEIAQAVELPGLHAEGIFTHFSDADGSEEYTMLQFDRFLDILQRVQTLGHTFAIRHCANSAATLLYPATYLDMVRPGIALYGHFPDGNMDPALCDLQPVMEVKSRVVTVRTVPAGTPVSYGRTNVLQRQTRLAVVPIGYGDGYCRGFSNRLSVLFPGGQAPVTGRVCMDMCMVDVTDLPEVTEGSVAVIYGHTENGEQSVEAGATVMNTISYELLCVLTRRIPRIYR